MKFKCTLILSAALFTVILYCVNPNKNAFVPDEMAGYWAADSPKYEDCYLELSPVTVAYHTRDNNVDVHFVHGIEKEVKQEQLSYTIYYKNRSGQEGNVSLVWSPTKQEIVLNNQRKMTWRKVAQPY